MNMFDYVRAWARYLRHIAPSLAWRFGGCGLLFTHRIKFGSYGRCIHCRRLVR